MDQIQPPHGRSPSDELKSLADSDLLRSLRHMRGPQGATIITADGHELVNFASNDYLGLASHPLLKQAAIDAAGRWGGGAGAARLVCGTLAPHDALEERLAEFKKTDAALVFSSGYACAVGTVGAVAGKDDIVVLDKLCHASLVDGTRLSGATLRVFPHNHLDKLESHLRWARDHISPSGRIIVVVESIYSMDGDTSPLREIVELKNRFGALLLVDEAHSVGLCGDQGRGLATSLGIDDQIDLQMGTLSKALGGSGGYICASRGWIDLLVNKARSFIFSTAPSPITVATAHAAIDLVAGAEGDARRQRLHANASSLREVVGSPDRDNPSAIVPWIIGDSALALTTSEQLRDSGILAPAIRFPTVPRDSARIRFTTTADHHNEHFEKLRAAMDCR